jgi:hypothetical protein
MNSLNNFNEFKNFNKYFFIYLLILSFCAVIHLYFKHTVGNDSTISEWIINYQGGLTRRGLLGEICFQIAKFFKIELRFVIFLFQSIFYIFLIILNFYFFKSIKHNILTIFAVFTPIFILYPVAEIEVLARKEIFLYAYFLGVIYLCDYENKLNKYLDSYILFITPIICLIYEQIILFFPFIVACLIFHRKIITFKSFMKTCLLFVPSLSIIIFFFISPPSMEDHEIMKKSLMTNFNEKCYMSCELLRYFDINKAGFIIKSTFVKASLNEIILWIFRYILIFLIGFFPLLFLSFHSKIKEKNFFSTLRLNNITSLMFFLYLPIIALFVIGSDWGRWIGMMISFSTYLYFYLYKNDHIDVDFLEISKKLSFFKNKKKLIIFIFIIFAFGWNQKTSRSGDVATNPLWKIPYNTSKKVFGWNSFRILEDSIFLIWHQKYIE